MPSTTIARLFSLFLLPLLASSFLLPTTTTTTTPQVHARRRGAVIAKEGQDFDHLLATFEETKDVVGFPAYYVAEDKAAGDIEAFRKEEEGK